MSFAFLYQRLWAFRWPLSLCLALMVIESALVLIVPWLGGKIAGGLLSATDVSFGVLAGALIAIFAGQAVLRVVQSRILQGTAESLTAELRSDLYDQVQRLPLPWLDDRPKGKLLSLLTRDVDVLSDFATSVLLGVLPKLIVLTGAVILMLQINPFLSIPVILGVPVFFLLLKILGRSIRPLSAEIREAYAKSVSVADENLSIMQAIKAYTREDLEAHHYQESVFDYRDKVQKLIAHQSLLGPVIQFIAAASVVLVLWVAGGQVTDGTMSPGALVSFLLYAALLTRPVAGIGDLWGQIQHARGALIHMDEVLSVSQEASGGRPLPANLRGALSFKDVTFSYPDRPALLKGLTFDIEAGETVAITGENGAGKTTITDLLMRFREPGSGQITLDGQSTRELDLSDLRRAIALVPQRVALIDGTIGENIEFGRPGAKREEIETAAKNAHAWGFISELPEGLDTVIGERGIRLSGGQRQRVSLARSLLKKPAILILDEPTSMFDPEGEAHFVELARAALKGHTVILITHRPASLALADSILALDDGRIVETNNQRLLGNG